ncbi:glycosyl-phosphatidylinositol-anchored molecule-like protein [Hippopotamus amphibius kiboko]|uniref:glycosyl-phosphatidylinositol-anchored molecule-like protein n=1 Tax=Hippopotamus amphibius kiboko TaxID=575201 RepID=UPI002599ED45|nr:glycosyl-phosphatidylinositol-anchored molecule-like protein [Hippopotamus amphibius kiboko]XP_057593254.1 glycosyl-phosphatidylinositol-anchored molecule-like protein [Hippopotamus amphibius kiboko]XP_057593255.1 glycosyl-phosphatidylinositol-anchored molecule-like protein [Hippopotamus amphibius kiboko]
MMLLFALPLLMGWPLGFVDSAWTYNLKCHECAVINTFSCSKIKTCDYNIRRCMTVSIRLSTREMLVLKNCTYNCTFMYSVHQPPEAPRKKYFPNSFYWVNCCGSMTCNFGGPTNLERDIAPDDTIEEELEGTERLGESALLLSFASILVSNTLT